MNSEEMRCLGGLQGALASPRDGMHPADFRASCRAPSGGRFYVASSLPSSSEIRSGWDVARVPDVSFQEAGDPSGIIPAVPGASAHHLFAKIRCPGVSIAVLLG